MESENYVHGTGCVWEMQTNGILKINDQEFVQAHTFKLVALDEQETELESFYFMKGEVPQIMVEGKIIQLFSGSGSIFISKCEHIGEIHSTKGDIQINTCGPIYQVMNTTGNIQIKTVQGNVNKCKSTSGQLLFD